jgi:hypothetical protein
LLSCWAIPFSVTGLVDIVLDFPAPCNRIAGLQAFVQGLAALLPGASGTRVICDPGFRRQLTMRRYDKSIALYERTKRHLAGGVSSNVR